MIRCGLLVAVLLAVLAGGEIVARGVGRRPWRVEDLRIVVEPGGTFFRTHPTRGYSHLPGTFKVTLRTGYAFTATNGPDTLRITHLPGRQSTGRAADQMWIFGCSITYGWSVNDWETYPWLLQEQLPGKEVVNFGVNGYGTLQSLIQFREALEHRHPPGLVVLSYAQIHDERNTFTRARKKTVAPWNRLGPLLQPYGRFDADGHLQVAMGQVEYTEFPLMRASALSHWLEQSYNRFEDRAVRSHEVTLKLIEEFADTARSHGVPILLAGIWESKLREVLDWAAERKIPAADISVNEKERRYRNVPHDPHPNPLAHIQYAAKLRKALVETGYLGSTGSSQVATHRGQR